MLIEYDKWSSQNTQTNWYVEMCSICFACCPPRGGLVVIGILQLFFHITLFILNNENGYIQLIAYASDDHSKITMIIFSSVGGIAALILIVGAATKNATCLHIWTAVNTLIITALTMALIYCAFVAHDKDGAAKHSLWETLKRLVAFATYKKFFKRMLFYVTLIVMITLQIFVTFIAHDFTRDLLLEDKLYELEKRSKGEKYEDEDDEDDSSPRYHSRKHRRRHSRQRDRNKKRHRHEKHHCHHRDRSHSDERGEHHSHPRNEREQPSTHDSAV